MYSLMSTTSLCNFSVSKLPLPTTSSFSFVCKNINPRFLCFRKALRNHANATNEVDTETQLEEEEEALQSEPKKESNSISSSTASTATKPLDKDLKKVFFFFFKLGSFLNGNFIGLVLKFEYICILL